MNAAHRRLAVLCRALIGLFLISHAAFAQRYQLGGLIGGGTADDGEVSVGPYVLAGVEGCVLCGGRFGLVFEYTHWQLAGDKNNPTSLDLAGGGFRVQGKGRRMRPFFDIVIVGGREQCECPLYSGRVSSRSVSGAGIGFGAAVSIGARWYVRPQVRAYGTSGGYVAGSASAGIGYRF
jgi:hypothetical protein